MVIAASPTQTPMLGVPGSNSLVLREAPIAGNCAVGGGCNVVAITLNALTSNQLLVFSRCLYLLRRILHNVIAAGTLNPILVRIVIHHRVLATEVVPRRRRRHGPLQRCALPRILRRRRSFE